MSIYKSIHMFASHGSLTCEIRLLDLRPNFYESVYESELYISLVWPHGVEHTAQILHRIPEGQAR